MHKIEKFPLRKWFILETPRVWDTLNLWSSRCLLFSILKERFINSFKESEPVPVLSKIGRGLA